MDQIGDAVETALTRLLANASIHISGVRRTKVLEDYNKKLVPFAAESERDWTSGAPRLFGPKEASDYLQQLQLVRKVKEKLVFHQPPPAHPAGGAKNYSNKQYHRQQPYPRTAVTSKKMYPAGKRSAMKK